MSGGLTRRRLLLAGAVAAVAGCRASPPSGAPPNDRTSRPSGGRLTDTAPDPTLPATLPPGTSPLELENGEQALVHVPANAQPALVVSLHGAGGDAGAGLALLQVEADRLGFVVLAPASAGSTWGAVRRGADPDTPALGAALAEVLGRHPVDPARLGVAGFSDGASYALTLGLENGDLLRRVVAFSPGSENAAERHGRPEFFVTHGTGDPVLPIERTSRVLVPALRRDGYEVVYREFDGPHVVPADLRAEAAEWATRA